MSCDARVIPPADNKQALMSYMYILTSLQTVYIHMYITLYLQNIETFALHVHVYSMDVVNTHTHTVPGWGSVYRKSFSVFDLKLLLVV